MVFNTPLPGVTDKQGESLLNSFLQYDYRDAKERGWLPKTFPLPAWQAQLDRYNEYWEWWSGEALMEADPDDNTLMKYPLQVNSIRGFSRKLTALLFGEIPETTHNVVNYIGYPKPIMGDDVEDSVKKEAKFYAEVINEMWHQSDGNSLLIENGNICHFMGGTLFGLDYVPHRDDLSVPILVRSLYPNFVLPLWSPEDYFDLQELFIVYHIDPHQAEELVPGIVLTGGLRPLYTEHWTKEHVTRAVNGIPITYVEGGKETVYNQHPHGYGFVPFVYIPAWRSGSFHGDSFIPYIKHMQIELNQTMADRGDAVNLSAHRLLVGTDISERQTEIFRRVKLPNGTIIFDLGSTSAATKATPKVGAVDPPAWDSTFAEYPKDVWQQMLREIGLSPISFGEDEGSQRSALTLAFRMWPATANAKMTRVYWSDGLRKLAYYALRIMAMNGDVVAGKKISKDFAKQFRIIPDFYPMIPRDREQILNEIAIRTSGEVKTLSQRDAMIMFGDLVDIDGAIAQIQKEEDERAERSLQNQEKQKSMEMKYNVQKQAVSTGLDEAI